MGNGTVCLMGDCDKASHKFDRKRVHAIDYGLDFYAPQHCDGITFEAEGNVLMDVEKYDLTFDKEI